MEIVANSMLLKKFKTIDIFTLDLGFNLKGPVSMKPTKNEDTGKIKIRDEFIIRYNTLYNRYINKFGHIGVITFYEDLYLKSDEIYIFKDKEIYEVNYTIEDSKKEIRSYLSELLKEIDSSNTESQNNESSIVNTIYTNIPDNIIKPDITMPNKEQYIDAMVERRRKLEKL